MIQIILLILLAMLCFLFTFNLFNRGRYTEVAGGILGYLIFFLIGSAFFVANWYFALLLFALSFVFIAVSKPLATPLARRLLGRRVGMEQLRFERYRANDFFAAMQQREEVARSRISSISRNLKIGQVLARHQIAPNELYDLYLLLEQSRLHDIAFEIISHPDELETLIQYHREQTRPAEIYAHYRQLT